MKFSTTYELAVFGLCQAWCIEIYDFIDLHFRFQRFALALDRVESVDLIEFKIKVENISFIFFWSFDTVYYEIQW